MNDKRTTYRIYYLLPALFTLLLSSCSQEYLEAKGALEEDDRIIFHMSLPGVETRSYDNIDAGNLVGGFSVSAMNLDSLINEDLSKVAKPKGKGTYTYEGKYNKIDLCIQNAPVGRTKGMGDAFRGDSCRWPKAKDGKDGLLQFFAYYPSLETLRAKAGLDPKNTTNFYVNHPSNDTRSELRDTGYWFNYRMSNFLINKDISSHADFVGASVRGSRTNNLYSGVDLQFEHKLCKVDLKAFGTNEGYDIEIAGVRIGGVMTNSTYNLAGNWISHGATWDYVEYVYNEGNKDRESDQILHIRKGSHDSKTDPVSIMGNGGYALLIPHKPSNLASGIPYKWDNINSPQNPKTGTNKNVLGMYFSVLMRVIDKTDDKGNILYPYADGASITDNITASNKNSVYLVVDKTSEKVKGRVYKNKTSKQYFSDSALKTPYTLAEGLEIREYGWAAIPYVDTWYIGKSYTYILDYSSGIGVHAPDDDAPGKPIIQDPKVDVTDDEEEWKMVTDYEDEEIEEGKNFTFTQE